PGPANSLAGTRPPGHQTPVSFSAGQRGTAVCVRGAGPAGGRPRLGAAAALPARGGVVPRAGGGVRARGSRRRGPPARPGRDAHGRLGGQANWRTAVLVDAV